MNMLARRNITNISQYRRSRRRVNSFRSALIVVFLVACIFAGYFFAISPFFNVREITIMGNSEVSSQRVIHLSGIVNGTNIFAVNKDRVTQWLTIEPMVLDATIKRKLPDKIIITITEREAVAILPAGSHFIEIDSMGKILARYEGLSQFRLPIITGVNGFQSAAYPGVTIHLPALNIALQIIKDLQQDGIEPKNIGEIDLSNLQQISLYTVGGTEIHIGNGDRIKEKYIIANGIISNHTTSGTLSTIRYIDVSSNIPAILYKP